MLARVVRRVPLNEVRRRMAELDGKHGGKLPALIGRSVGDQLDKEMLEDYVEWSMMFHALRAYGEGEEFEYYTEETVNLGWREISRLTPRRLELLDRLSHIHVESINDLAAQVGRDVKNVHGDLQILRRLGFIRLVRRGRRILPVLVVQEITLLLG